ncbi:hypothetical protein NPIL_55881 [Nephila pilipes]|uniref:Uncharacterized protein n=1 Tax=Nephila pilipes TaxID=299642 RepID=A0A8X6NZ09_NEPPI|nr:hypothetical protein NPIL_55881 [Nephila pilipes]
MNNPNLYQTSRAYSQWLNFAISHLGVHRNKKENVMAMHGAKSKQLEIPQTLKIAYNQTTTNINSFSAKTLKNSSKEKIWKVRRHVSLHLEHVEAMARFRLMKR